jgi:D-glycero-alpha-D-manno-heptose 1-phosphate guanylyltransferase
MIKEAIILAGGLGTRLRSVVADLPKCMAPVAGKPFLHYVIDQLREQGIEHFIVSVGYKSERIVSFVNKEYVAASGIDFRFAHEVEPLGTGGAIQLASQQCTDAQVLVCNGDTLFRINTAKLEKVHLAHAAECTLCLKPMKDFNRYGAVEINEDGRVITFREKQYYDAGLVNGGVYALDVQRFLANNLPEKFSFEKEYLEKMVVNKKLYAVVQDEYFIDIGIPDDYQRAQNELRQFA